MRGHALQQQALQKERQIRGAYYYQQLFTTFLQFTVYKVIIGSLRAPWLNVGGLVIRAGNIRNPNGIALFLLPF